MEHYAIVSFRRKQFSLKCPSGEFICVRVDETDCTTNVIPALLARKLIRKGCEAYLAYALDSKVAESKLNKVLIVKEYVDVFPEELPGLPSSQEVEFEIELVPRIAPISLTSYKISPTKLKELKHSCKSCWIANFLDRLCHLEVLLFCL